MNGNSACRSGSPGRLATALALSARLALGGLAACAAAAAEGSIRFNCPPASRQTIQADMDAYLAGRGIAPSLFVSEWEQPARSLLYTLRTGPGDGDTLTLRQRRELAITEEVVTLPAPRGKSRQLRTV